MNKIKRIWIYLLAGVMAFCCYSCGTSKHVVTTVAKVNDEAITSEELDYFKSRLKSQVMNDYLEKYDITYSEGFWQKSFDGKTPEKALYDLAFEKCVMAKIQFVLMREKGIYKDISYSGLYDLAVRYNKENETKENVVGVKNIQLTQFYSYYLENGIMQLRNTLAEKEIKPTESEISKKADELKKSYPDECEENLAQMAEKQLIQDNYETYISNLRSQAKIDMTED